MKIVVVEVEVFYSLKLYEYFLNENKYKQIQIFKIALKKIYK